MKSILRSGLQPCRRINSQLGARKNIRGFRSTTACFIVKPFLLADIGEGIREVQIIQWFVQPGARVEQFDKLCEVQSDKASVEITSRFDGIIKKLHYDADDMAIVGKPLVDIDIQSEIIPDDEALTTPPAEQAGNATAPQQPQKAAEQEMDQRPTFLMHDSGDEAGKSISQPFSGGKGKAAKLATPAVRHLTKEHDVDIADIEGTGKDGRVLKEDIQRFVTGRSQASSAAASRTTPDRSSSPSVIPPDRTISLSPTQSAMFKTMTRSISIPHFLYSDNIEVGPINALRRTLNSQALPGEPRLTLLPFLIKALSSAINQHPVLNARIEAANEKPTLTLRGAHDVGIAVDTPQGLIVPVIKAVQQLSILQIATEASRLSSLARQGKLAAADMTGGTFTVSNIGNIGGGVLAPVIVEAQAGIVAVGRSKVVPALGVEGELIRKEEVTLSWSADHRIVDGATLARAAEHVRQVLEKPGRLLVRLR